MSLLAWFRVHHHSVLYISTIDTEEDNLMILDICFQVILLDTRYHRDPIGSDGTILGDSQWAWLEKELKGPGSELTIIASSIQVYLPFTSLFFKVFFFLKF